MSYGVFDDVEVRCPRLGGEVTFAYCRAEQDGLPCARALVCFERKFPVEVFFRKILRDETYRRCFEEPGPSRYERFLKAVSAASEGSGEADD